MEKLNFLQPIHLGKLKYINCASFEIRLKSLSIGIFDFEKFKSGLLEKCMKLKFFYGKF